MLDRLIQSGSDEGDIVLDPFCGCATACVAAETLHRQWIGIDLSELAATLVKTRLRDRLGLFGDIHHRTDIPRRTDLGKLPNYRAHKHALFGKQEGHGGGGELGAQWPRRSVALHDGTRRRHRPSRNRLRAGTRERQPAERPKVENTVIS